MAATRSERAEACAMSDLVKRRDKQVIRVSAAILVANVSVAVFKLIYGVAFGSIAIQADGFHSLFDGVNNVVIIVAMTFAGKPADANHPYGHRKIEVLASLFIGFMFAVMILRTASDAVSALIAHEQRVIAPQAYAVVLITIAVNLVVTVSEHLIAKRLQSDLLLADARHTLSDVIVSAAVLAGVSLNRIGVPSADAISALVVVAVVAWVGYRIVRNAIAGLADEVALPAPLLRAEAMTVSGVKSVERVRSRKYGSDVKVDVVIKVDAGLTILRAHAIADAVEAAIGKRFSEVSDIFVHVEPA